MAKPASVLTWRPALMIGAPLAPGVVELWHYLPNLAISRFEDLAPRVDQWLTVHMIQGELGGQRWRVVHEWQAALLQALEAPFQVMDMEPRYHG